MISTRSMLASQIVRRTQNKLISGPTRSFASPAVRRFQKEQAQATPSLDVARAMPSGFGSMDNNTLITVAAMEVHEARVEVLKRHIMSADGVSYERASETFDLVAVKNREGMWMAALPYKVGIGLAVTAAFGSLPMVFNLGTALSFNEDWVTTDIPEPRDLETMLEVGSWTWNWMEPPLGTLSFSLLSLQFARAQMENLGVKPYTHWLKSKRAESLVVAFPQYNPMILRTFSATDPMVKY